MKHEQFWKTFYWKAVIFPIFEDFCDTLYYYTSGALVPSWILSSGYSTCRHGFPTGSPVSSQLLKHACRWIGGSKWIQVWTCVCGALWWIGTPSSVYSRFTPSVPEIYGGSSATLTRIKHVAKMNEWNFGMFNWIDPHFYFLGQGHASHLNQQPWNVFTALLRSYNATTQTHFRRLCFACTVFL